MYSNARFYYKYRKAFLIFKPVFYSPLKTPFLLVFLIYFAPFLLPGSFASSSSFHRNLPENRREEITIVDDYAVRVGLGSDQQSVSCTILDAVGSLPSIDGATEPNVVYVNNEMVHHIRKGLYTWDRNGKYRVRLTTKYIRQFGEILIRIPGPNASQPVIEKSENLTPLFYQSLPENKREEITIIDSYMVEVGLGPDLRSVASNIQDAIQSIPMVGEEEFPEFDHENFIWQELLADDDQEFTCAAYSPDKIEKQILIIKRTLDGGVTGSGEIVDNSEILEYISSIMDAFQLKGVMNVQLRLTKDGPVLFEINPRLSSTVVFRDKLGFTDLKWWINDLTSSNKNIYCQPEVGTKFYRKTHEYIITND